MMAVGKSIIPRVWEQMVSRKLGELDRRVRSLEVNSPASTVAAGNNLLCGFDSFVGNDTNSVAFTITHDPLIYPSKIIFVGSPTIINITGAHTFGTWSGEVHHDGLVDDGVTLSLAANIETGVFYSPNQYWFGWFMSNNPPPPPSS